jgi:hypothetical protein
MRRKTITAALLSPVVLLLSSSLIQAEENSADAGDADRDGYGWQSFSADMSPSEYKYAVRANHKQVRKFVKSYSSEALSAAGVPKAGIAFLGAAAGLAVDGDARLPINDSKTLAFQFDNVVDSERALLFTFKKSW